MESWFWFIFRFALASSNYKSFTGPHPVICALWLVRKIRRDSAAICYQCPILTWCHRLICHVVHNVLATRSSYGRSVSEVRRQACVKRWRTWAWKLNTGFCVLKMEILFRRKQQLFHIVTQLTTCHKGSNLAFGELRPPVLWSVAPLPIKCVFTGKLCPESISASSLDQLQPHARGRKSEKCRQRNCKPNLGSQEYWPLAPKWGHFPDPLSPYSS